MASRNHYLVCVTEVSVGKGESKSHRDNPMIFYYFFEVVALFFALNSSYFAFCSSFWVLKLCCLLIPFKLFFHLSSTVLLITHFLMLTSVPRPSSHVMLICGKGSCIFPGHNLYLYNYVHQISIRLECVGLASLG